MISTLAGCAPTASTCTWVTRFGGFNASTGEASVFVSFEEFGPLDAPRPASIQWRVSPDGAISGIARATIDTIAAAGPILELPMPGDGVPPDDVLAEATWQALIRGRGRVQLLDDRSGLLAQGALALTLGDGLPHSGCFD